MPLTLEQRKTKQAPRGLMKANVFRGQGEFGLEEKPIPRAGAGEAVVRVRLTTICGTDIHIVKGEYPIEPGTGIGHEAVGVIHELGSGVTGYHLGQRVLLSAVTPCGQCEACLSGHTLQCGGLIGGFGNTMDGVQAEFVRVPFAQANLALVPGALSKAALRGGPRHSHFHTLRDRRKINVCGRPHGVDANNEYVEVRNGAYYVEGARL